MYTRLYMRRPYTIIAKRRVGNVGPRSSGLDEEESEGTSAVKFAML
jgi:hypothetical protein